MKIAIGTDDRATIRRGHFGESTYFCIFTVFNAQIHSEECRDNPYHLERHIPEKFKKIEELLHDCDVLVGRSMGHEGFTNLPLKGKQILITTHEQIDEAIDAFLSGRHESFKIYDMELRKFVNLSS